MAPSFPSPSPSPSSTPVPADTPALAAELPMLDRRGQLTTFDDDSLDSADAAGAPGQRPLRRRGRPRRSLGTTVLDNSPVTQHDIAFLRAYLQGVSLAQAARTYGIGAAGTAGGNASPQDGHAAQAYLTQLLERLRWAAGDLPERETALAFIAELERLQARPGSMPAAPASSGPAGVPAPAPAAAAPPAAAARAPARPSLEAFAQRFPDDMYSEAELIELYEEEFGAAQDPMAAERATLAPPAFAAPTAAAPVTPPAPRLALVRQLEILDWLAPRVNAAPTGPAPLALWVGTALAQTLRQELGLTTLAQLAAFVNARGPRWWDAVPGLGRERAGRLLAWLWQHEEGIGVRLRSRLVAPLQRRGAPWAVGAVGTGGAPAGDDVGAAPVQVHALVPLDQFFWPPELLGGDGVFRSPSANTLGARDDRDALEAWLARHTGGKSKSTQEISRRALERLVLWAVLERRRALSSLTSDDLIAFREFLYDPPAHWCSQERVMRLAQEWRPLRGALSEVGVGQILGVVRQMFAGWHAAGYLYADASHGVGNRSSRGGAKAGTGTGAAAAPARPGRSLNVKRSFVHEDLLAMRATLDAMPDGPARRRLRAILSLFLDSGLRRSEVNALTLGMFEPVRLANTLSDVMQITVLGKGGKERELPVMASTLQALEAHYEDRLALIAAGRLPQRFGHIPREATPLLSILREVRPSGHAGPGHSPADAPRAPNPDGRLDGASLYGILKAFFKKVGQRGDLVRGQADFDKASTHWLRHTFAHRVLATGQAQLPTVQALLGHENISTTGLYLEADMSDRVRAVAAVVPVF